MAAFAPVREKHWLWPTSGGYKDTLNILQATPSWEGCSSPDDSSVNSVYLSSATKVYSKDHMTSSAWASNVGKHSVRFNSTAWISYIQAISCLRDYPSSPMFPYHYCSGQFQVGGHQGAPSVLSHLLAEPLYLSYYTGHGDSGHSPIYIRALALYGAGTYGK